MTQLFQLRKELSVSVGNDESMISYEESSVQKHFSNEVILTENGKYKVSRLLPSLSFLPPGYDLSCSVDTRTGYASCSDSQNVYIWPFQSQEVHPNFMRIPLHDDPHEAWSHSPLTSFTWPSVLDRDLQTAPGLFIINIKSGDIQFYEDLDTVHQTPSFITQSKRHSTKMKLKNGEEIVSLINAEPAGLLISTNYGRLQFCTIRDPDGKPLVTLKQSILKCQVGIFSSMSSSKNLVSVKAGEVSGKGERIISVLTSGGDFQVWTLSSSGYSYQRFDVNIWQELSSSILEHFPFATNKLQILDSHPLPVPNAYLILCCIAEKDRTHYILATIIIEESTNSFSLFSTYRLNTYTEAFSKGASPKLIIPSASSEDNLPIITIFSLFNDSVVLTQFSSKLDHGFPFRRKWEDIIRFKKDTDIIGYSSDVSSVYVLDRAKGSLRIETFEKYEKADLQETRFIKSHVDQYIYFGQQSADSLLDFDLPSNLELLPSEIEADIQLSSDEIKFSMSSHIPPIADNVQQNFKIRTQLFQRLLKFVSHNFTKDLSVQFKLDLVADFEILKCAEKLYSLLPTSSEAINSVWYSALKEYLIQDDASFAGSSISKLPELFGAFCKNLTEIMKSSSNLELKIEIISLLNSVIYQAVLEESENGYRYGVFQLSTTDISSKLPWFTNNGILESLNDAFFDVSYSVEDLSSYTAAHQPLLLLVKTLYYLVREINLWLKTQSITDPKYAEFFNENHLLWNKVLVIMNKSHDSILITDFYHDFDAMVETLQSLPAVTAFTLYDDFFEKYSYDFAKPLFKHYVINGKWDELYSIFSENRNELLQRFFEENQEFDKVKWIGQIYSEDYSGASKTLLQLATGTSALGSDLKKRQAQLSISKLASLEAETLENSRIELIQKELDLIDGQILISKKIEAENFSTVFSAMETYKVIFKVLTDAVKRNESLSIPHLVEVLTLLNSDDCFGYALRILSIDRTLPAEVKNYCEYQTWRRSLLNGEESFKQTLQTYFEEELYSQYIELPVLANLLNKNLISKSYLEGVYHGLANLTALSIDLKNEIQLLESQNFSTGEIQSLIATVNTETGNKCVINYESNTIEIKGTS